MFSPAVILAAALALVFFLVAGFFPRAVANWVNALPAVARLFAPAVLCVPYLLVAETYGAFRWSWFVLYALVPVGVALLLFQARLRDVHQRGNWRDFLVLIALGLAVDLRWFEHAWPTHLAVFNKFLLLETGIYGFLGVRQLNGVGFDLRLRGRDFVYGMREFLFYAPLAIPIGLGLGFLHFHGHWPPVWKIAEAVVFTLLFIAAPEEIFFRGWLQNLLQRRLGNVPALLITAMLFGLAHWNKRTLHFNWRYVLLAALAGIFYGRAWQKEQRVPASAITHTCVDSVWSLWLR